MSAADHPLHKTPLHALHTHLQARMVPFAGYSMPVQYASGVIAEHRHTRTAAGLFDVSHMGQIRIDGPRAAEALERVLPIDVLGLAEGQQRYGFLTNEHGGLLDDLMVFRPAADAGLGAYLLVVNAGRKQEDLAHLQAQIGALCTITPQFDRALLALQGPQAARVLHALNPAVDRLRFMQGLRCELSGVDAVVTRSGYTGEDGFEISIEAPSAIPLAERLLDHPGVQAIGLGARDTLRLEAGLCLYGHDIDTTTNPVEAGLTWAMQKVRRPGGARAGGFLGAQALALALEQGPARRRVGLVGTERAPVREGTSLHASDGHAIGVVTSGTVGPTVQRVIAMGYVATAAAVPGTVCYAEVRGKRLPMEIVPLPFVSPRYLRA